MKRKTEQNSRHQQQHWNVSTVSINNLFDRQTQTGENRD